MIIIYLYFVINCGKNIYIFIFLADNFRPYLTSFQGNAFTDYINAVFVDVSINLQYIYFFDVKTLTLTLTLLRVRVALWVLKQSSILFVFYKHTIKSVKLKIPLDNVKPSLEHKL